MALVKLAILQASSGLDLASGILVILVVIFVAALAYYIGRYQGTPSLVSSITVPNLEELVVRGKYEVPYSDVNKILEIVVEKLNFNYRGPVIWGGAAQGNMISLRRDLAPAKKHWWSFSANPYFDQLRRTRAGVTRDLDLICRPLPNGKMEVEATAKPVMYYTIVQQANIQHLEQSVSDARIEAVDTMKLVMVGILQGVELEAPSVKPILKTSAIRTKLIEMNLSTCNELLIAAEMKITQGHPEDAVKNCRSVVELIVESTSVRTVGKADKFSNTLAKLRSNGRIDGPTEKFVLAFYSFTSEDVHDRFRADQGEATVALRVTEAIADYFMKL